MSNPLSSCPEWDRFLERVTGENQQLVSFLQRAVGYSLSGDTSEQCLFFLYGEGANGKSTFLNTFKTLLNDYARQANSETFMVKDRNGGASPELARLRGARLVVTTEIEDGQRLAESLIKQITGQDPITVRQLYCEPFEYIPSFKVWIAANHKPEIRGQDLAIWRRINLVPFTVTIPENERDKDLPEKLNRELPGILAWAIEGFRLWKEKGLAAPGEVKIATEEYRHDMDYVAQWIEERCKCDQEQTALAAVLYGDYALWAERARVPRISQNKFGRMLSQKGFTKKATPSRSWEGIGIKNHHLAPEVP